jgi:copper(I)-binding protein
MKLHSLIAAAALVFTAAVQAQPKIEHPYARATMPGQPNGGGYLKIDNAGGAADRLVAASADVSRTVELHTMKLEGDVMRMRQIDAIDVPAGQTIELKPGGMHLMFIGLKAPLKAGDSFPVKLRFEKAGERVVEVKVEAAAPAAGGHGHGMKH